MKIICIIYVVIAVITHLEVGKKSHCKKLEGNIQDSFRILGKC